MTYKRILIAVDNDPVAASAADAGVELARALGAEIALIHVVDTTLSYGADTGLPPGELIGRAKQEGRAILDGFRQRLSLPPATLEFVQAGSPAEETIKAAKDWSSDLIVVGSHGRGGIRRAVLGSVAEAVMRNAPCPVLVVRAKG